MSMMAFDHIFFEIAQRDACVVERVETDTGKRQTFLFREYFCNEPRCDCRRVIVSVMWGEETRVVASLDYAFEKPRRRGERQLQLDVANPQSEHAEMLLGVFGDMVAKDPTYRDTLLDHYARWKAVVDDPRHPLHRKARGLEPKMDLERVVAKAGAAESKVQRRFKRLLEKVEQLRGQLRAWKNGRSDIDREIASYQALFEQQPRHVRAVVERLDRAYRDASFTKTDRKKLAEVLANLIGELLEHGGHDDLKEMYRTYSRSDFDAEVAQAETEQLETLQAMMEMFGIDYDKAKMTSMQGFEELAAARLAEDEREEAARQERQQRRKKSPKQMAAEVRRAEEQRTADKAIQDVYRTLAKALHPDRELVPEERERKAEVMREVNIAYEANDLLRLLELQLQLENVDASRVETLAEERVHSYIKVLDTQAKQLAGELEELELPYRRELDLPPRIPLGPADVVAQMRGEAAAIQMRIDALARDARAFEDLRCIKVWLKSFGRPRAGRGGERFETY